MLQSQQRMRRWAALITLGVWVAMICVALLLARKPAPPRPEPTPRVRQPVVSDPPPLPKRTRLPFA